MHLCDIRILWGFGLYGDKVYVTVYLKSRNAIQSQFWHVLHDCQTCMYMCQTQLTC